MTGQHDRRDERLTGQLPNQFAHCLLTGRYFEPCNLNLKFINSLKKVFNLDLNLFTSSIDLMSIGKSFQSIGAITEKALKPYVFKLLGLIARRHLSEDELSGLMKKIAAKSCSLDPVPASLLRYRIDDLLPIMKNVVNLSFNSASMPSSMKNAVLSPLLKKPSLDFEILLKT